MLDVKSAVDQTSNLDWIMAIWALDPSKWGSVLVAIETLAAIYNGVNSASFLKIIRCGQRIVERARVANFMPNVPLS